MKSKEIVCQHCQHRWVFRSRISFVGNETLKFNTICPACERLNPVEIEGEPVPQRKARQAVDG